MRLVNAIVYECESWALTVSMEERLRGFQQRFLRGVTGMLPREVNGELRYPPREAVLQRAGAPDVVSVVKHRRLQLGGCWLGQHYECLSQPRTNSHLLVTIMITLVAENGS